jgi:tetratricopeptide (TPR) repeat protein
MKTRLAASLTILLLATATEVQSSNPAYINSETRTLLQQGTQAFQHRDYATARKFFDTAVTHDPKSWTPYLARACVWIQERKWSQAREDLDMVVRLKPSHFQAALLRGDMQERLGNHQRALGEYDHLVKITVADFPPECALVLSARAWLLATCPDASFRNAKQAIEDAKRACELSTWRKPGYIDTLAAAYAEAGDWDSAIRFQQQAISRFDKQARSIKNPEAVSASQKAIASHLAAYQRHQAWRSNPNAPFPIEMR